MAEDRPFIITPQVQQVWDRVHDARSWRRRVKHGSENRHVLLLGESGTGKTLTALEYSRRFGVPTTLRNDMAEWDVRPVVHVTAPAPFTVKNLYKTILEDGYGIGVRATQRTEDLVATVKAAIRNCETEILIIDEIQHTLTPGQPQAILMDNIKVLAVRANVVLWLCGMPSAGRLLDLDAQYERRFTVCWLEDWKPDDPAWEQCIRAFADALGRPYEAAMLEAPMLKVLHQATGGKMWRVADVFDRARDLALKQRSAVTLDIIGTALDNHFRSTGRRPGADERTA